MPRQSFYNYVADETKLANLPRFPLVPNTYILREVDVAAAFYDELQRMIPPVHLKHQSEHRSRRSRALKHLATDYTLPKNGKQAAELGLVPASPIVEVNIWTDYSVDTDEFRYDHDLLVSCTNGDHITNKECTGKTWVPTPYEIEEWCKHWQAQPDFIPQQRRRDMILNSNRLHQKDN